MEQFLSWYNLIFYLPLAIGVLFALGAGMDFGHADIHGDVSWSKFVEMLKYKAEWNGKKLLKIGRYDPSSKKCSNCGNVYSNLKLEERTWECESCGKAHDRDINAAINVLKFGMEQAEFKCLENENSIGSPCL